ncbi:hypothetical protein [Tabrizicola sp.]|uniref:hypothetical protein n=1 Tax=Tabrizicola sp. TaxID=2005166 RepID=UPI0027347D9F|nr:hypothetical protein [Tabrizicola sp.]MDP3194874.1 hypothetical protein [Tabrizicola sp.]
MTSESKILTVSYGTFSCTLEGFDDPFDTMKAIAEYFRDLAAQDRHFGAEPPPPDAAMLHRLAEREVARLAAGKLDDAARLNSADAVEGPAPRIQINPVLRRPAPPVEPEPQETEAPAPSLTDVIPDGVAAKLARIRRAVNPSVPLAEAPFRADPEVSAPLNAAETAEAALAETSPNDAGDVAERLGALISSDPSSDPLPASAAEVAVEDTVAFAADPTDPWTSEAAEAETDAPADDARFADVDADADAAMPLAADGAALIDEAPLPVEEDEDLVALAVDPVVEAAAPALSIVDDLDDAALATLPDHPVESDFTSEDVALLAQLDGTVFDETSLAASLDETLPEDQPVALDLADAALQDPLPESVSLDVSTDVLPEELADEVALADAPAAEAEAPADLPGKSGARSRRVNSRVVRIHPSQDARDASATRVLDQGEEANEVARLMQQADEVMADVENRRRHEALSRLKAAVVATEADRADIDYEAPKADANLDPYRDDLAEAIQPPPETDLQPEPEVKPTRRKSVTIRPSADPRPGTIRPGMISPPPLVLVSEQRIDRVGPAVALAPTATPTAAPAPAAAPQSAPTSPGIGHSDGQPMVALRTGRLSGAIGAGAAVASSSLPARNLVLEKPSYGTAAETEEDEDLAEDAKEINEAGLASFAEMVGARSMAEMLEAAAAYATCVENRSQFTRPQLMRRMMASAGGKSVSREDGLRSFGTLLRTGRIEKVTRGHYCLADNSPYLAEARRLS